MWDVWHAKEEDRLYTFTVLTTFPNEVSGQVHDRMPVIVQPRDYERWLNPENQDVADILATPPVRGLDRLPGEQTGQRPPLSLRAIFLGLTRQSALADETLQLFGVATLQSPRGELSELIPKGPARRRLNV